MFASCSWVSSVISFYYYRLAVAPTLLFFFARSLSFCICSINFFTAKSDAPSNRVLWVRSWFSTRMMDMAWYGHICCFREGMSVCTVESLGYHCPSERKINSYLNQIVITYYALRGILDKHYRDLTSPRLKSRSTITMLQCAGFSGRIEIRGQEVYGLRFFPTLT